METLNTVIKFVSSSNVNPEYVPGAQTSDNITVAVAIIAFICLIASVFCYVIKNVDLNQYTSFNKIGATVLNKSKIIIVAFAILATCFLITGVVFANAEKATAGTNEHAESSKIVNAIVDESTGNVTFEDGFIRVTGDKLVTLVSVKVDYLEDIDIKEDCEWQIDLIYEGQKYPIYNDIAGREETDQNLVISDNVINFGVTGMSSDVAKSLIDKEVLDITFTVDQMTQEEANLVVNTECQNLISKINSYAAVELLIDDRDDFLTKVNTEKDEVSQLIDSTKDPKKLSDYISRFTLFANNIEQSVSETKDQTVEDKTTFTATWNTNINNEINKVDVDSWIDPASQKSQFKAALNRTKNETLPLVANSTTHEDLDSAKEQTQAEYNDTVTSYEQASKESKEATISNAEEQAQTEIENATKQIDDTHKESLWEEDYDDIISSLQQQLSITEASLAELLTKETSTRSDMEAIMTNLQATIQVQRETAVTKAASADAERAADKSTIEEEKATLEQTKTNFLKYIYTDNKTTFTTRIDQWNALIDPFYQTKNHTDYLTKKDEIKNSFSALNNDLITTSNENKEEKESILAPLQNIEKEYENDVLALDNMSQNTKQANIQDLQAELTTAEDQILLNSKDKSDAQSKADNCSSEIEQLYTDIENSVRPWEFEWSSVPESLEVNDDSTYTFTTMSELLPTEERGDHVADGDPTYTLTGPTNDDGISISKNAQGYPVINVSESTEPAVYDKIVNVSYQAVIDYGNKKTKSFPIKITVSESCPTLFWGIQDGTLFLSPKNSTEATEEAPNAIDSTGENSCPWLSSSSAINKVEVQHQQYKKIKVKSMNSWFYNLTNCVSIQGINNDNFDTTNLTSIKSTFNGCEKLVNLILNNFNTSNVDNMSQAFSGCIKLKELDITSFSNSKVSNLEQMFYNCSDLTYIKASSENWKDKTYSAGSSVFYNCGSLKGYGKDGTFCGWAEEHKDGDYARICNEKIGYFSNAPVIDENPTLYYGIVNDGTDNILYLSPEKTTQSTEEAPNALHSDPLHLPFSEYCPWLNHADDINKVIIQHPGEKRLTPTSVFDWFGNFQNCYSIEGINDNNFDNRLLEHMGCLFSSCTMLESVDLSNFSTYSSLKNIYALVGNCTNLKNIKFSDNFDVSSVDDMMMLFRGCENLQTLDLSSFSTPSVTDFSYMFLDCKNLKTVDMSNFSNKSAFNVYKMFTGCSELLYIKVDPNKWPDLHTQYEFNRDTFGGCNKLIGFGADGSEWIWDETEIDSWSVRVCTKQNIGYFSFGPMPYLGPLYWGITESGEDKVLYLSPEKTEQATSEAPNALNPRTGQEELLEDLPWLAYHDDITKVQVQHPSNKKITPISMYSWFQNFSNCVEIDGINDDNFDTRFLESMSCTFLGNKKLENLDLSNLTTHVKFTYVSSTFKSCENLKTVNFSEKFNTSHIKSMESLFNNCTSLATLNITNFSNTSVENISNMFSGCSKLRYIKADSNKWASGHTYPSSDSVFAGCKILAGYGWDGSEASACAWSAENIGGDYACICSFSSRLGEFGYFSNVDEPEDRLYWGIVEGTLYLSPVVTNEAQAVAPRGLDPHGEPHTPWLKFRENITKISIQTDSEKKIKPISMYLWFYACTNCIEIQGIDDDHFDTSELTSMKETFAFCEKLETIHLDNFSTKSLQILAGTFNCCTSLTSVVFSDKFDTKGVTSMGSLFNGCTALQSIDISNFSNKSMSEITAMFSWCKNLQSIKADPDKWDSTHVYSELGSKDVFTECTPKLVGRSKGGNECVWRDSWTDASYAHVCTNVDPGYFSYS